MTDPETDPSRRPVPPVAAPSAERVADWLRALALLAGVLGALVALLTLELLGRL